MAINVLKADVPEQLQFAYKIRRKVFVEEQQVPEEEEIDEYEAISTHFLAYLDGVPAGAARWRFTEKGIKLERFAVLKEYRRSGVGAALVLAVLDDVKNHPLSAGKPVYLHAQISAIPLYEKHGFEKVGNLFQECEIDHFKMVFRGDSF